MLKVLHFYKTYYPNSYGGIEQVIFQISEGARDHGIRSTVLSLSPRNNVSPIPIGLHYCEYSTINFKIASTPFSFSAISLFKKLASETDIIHFHFPFPFMDILHFFVNYTKPTIVSYHSDIIKQKFIMKIYKPLMHWFLKDVSHIVASSPNYVASSKVLNRYKPKVSVIPFGLNRSLYPIVNKNKEAEWKKKIGNKFFLFIGAFRYYKGLYVLIEAARITKYPVVLMGTGSEEAKIKKYSTDLGLSNVYFLGALPDEDKVTLLSACYSVILPSYLRSEAFGITLLEGAMYGKALITCEIGTGTTYVNIHRETGMVITPFNPEDLADAMYQLWKDPIQTRLYGIQALKRFNKLFTSTKMVKKYVELYRSII